MSKANDITTAVFTFLNLNGWKVWRQNSSAVYDVKKQAFRTKGKTEINGVPDVIGYHKQGGNFIGVEVKANNDKLSDEQRRFIEDLRKAGGFGFVVRSTDDFMKQYKELYKNI